MCKHDGSDLSYWKSKPYTGDHYSVRKRELIKVAVLKNCIDDPREIAAVTAERTRSEVVKVIGKKIVLFRQAKKNTKYELPG